MPHPTPPTRKARLEAGPTVVVIEDEPQIRRFLRASLTTQGFRLVEAVTGEDGLVQAATRQPDIVILDLGLPDMDGLEVIRRLREWTAVPIIVLSARGQERDKIAALDAGADDYVSKPFGVGELLARMRVALRPCDHRDEGRRGAGLFRGSSRWIWSIVTSRSPAGRSTSPPSSTAC
ncbi:MAG: response regulator [Desulfobacterales bacterium]|nr:response regulator [Desulfobacterales bacterium]